MRNITKCGNSDACGCERIGKSLILLAGGFRLGWTDLVFVGDTHLVKEAVVIEIKRRREKWRAWVGLDLCLDCEIIL